ncbi:MAG TPA: glycosyltransferase family 9 protein [Nocardioidaceae bacterium]|nr:glycosyltransferase family 9 protein [Nocardioidaceae bacterium]
MALSQPAAVVLRALGLGDLLTAVPALRGVRRALPGHRLVLATDPALEELVHRIGVVDAVLPAHGLDPLEWAGPPPDVAVNLHGRGPQSHRLLGSLGACRLVAFGCADAGVSGPPWVPEEHEVRRWCRLVSVGLDVRTDPAHLRLPAPRPPVRMSGTVVVHPGAAHPARRWPADRFAAVASGLAEHAREVIVTGSANEAALGEEVAAAAGLTPTAVLAGKTSIAELVGLVSHARLVVCGDTGMAHLASAFGVPSVVLFGPTPPRWWGPPAHGPHIALWHGTQPGDPWAQSPDPALLAITVPEVLRAAQQLLE